MIKKRNWWLHNSLNQNTTKNRSNLTKILHKYYLRDEFGHPNLMEGGFN